MTISIILTKQEETALHGIAQQTGKSEHDLIREAVIQYIQRYQMTHRRQLLQQACGMWLDRMDLPPLETMRHEFDQRIVVK